MLATQYRYTQHERARVVVTAAQTDVQGAWQGTGCYANYSLVFCEHILAARVGTHPLPETRESGFTLDPEQGTIHILCSEGLQLGRYAIEGATRLRAIRD